MKTYSSFLVAALLAVLTFSGGLAGCGREPIERSGAELQVDEQLVELVMTAFGQSPAFKFPDVRVAAFKGKVQLSGFVQSDDQREAAGNIAKAIRGVTAVENSIALKP